MCDSEERVSFSLLLNPQYSALFQLWPVEQLNHIKTFSWGSENFKQQFPEKKSSECNYIEWIASYFLANKVCIVLTVVFHLFLQMIFQLLPSRIYNLKFRFRDTRQRLNLCIYQVSAKSGDLRHRFKIKVLFNDTLNTLTLSWTGTSIQWATETWLLFTLR